MRNNFNTSNKINKKNKIKSTIKMLDFLTNVNTVDKGFDDKHINETLLISNGLKNKLNSLQNNELRKELSRIINYFSQKSEIELFETVKIIMGLGVKKEINKILSEILFSNYNVSTLRYFLSLYTYMTVGNTNGNSPYIKVGEILNIPSGIQINTNYYKLHEQNIEEESNINGFTKSKVTSDFSVLQKFGIFTEEYINRDSNNKIDILKYLNLKENFRYKEIVYYKKLLNIFHSSKYLLGVISYDIGFDITKLTLQSQFHLLEFIYKSKIENYNDLKKIVKNIKGKGYTKTQINKNKDKNKLNFLSTFLACSETKEMGDKIIKVSSYPGSERVFNAYANLIKLQSKLGDIDNDFFLKFLKSLLKKGELLLIDYYNELKDKNELEKYSHDFKISVKEILDHGKYSQFAEKYSTHFAQSVAFIDGINNKLKNNEEISYEYFKKISKGFFDINKFNGGNILKSIDEENLNLSMLEEVNYNKNSPITIEDYKTIADIIINKSDYNKNLADNILKDLIRGFTDKNNQYIIIKDENSNFIGIIKKVNKGNYYYFGNLYTVSENQSCGMGTILEKISTNEVKKEIRADFYIHSRAFLFHIEKMGGIGNFMIKNEDGSYNGLMDFTAKNFNKNFKSKELPRKDLLKIKNQAFGEKIDIQKGIYGIKIKDSEIETSLGNILSENSNLYLTRVTKAKNYYSIIIEEQV